MYTFSFQTENPKEIEHLVKVRDVYTVLQEFDRDSLRNRVKHQDLPEAEAKLVQAIRTELWELMREYGIDLD